MKKICLFLVVILVSVSLFSVTVNPSLDGRALVADRGELPQGNYGKAPGYLPGDTVIVTNHTTGFQLEVMIISGSDSSEGVAIILAPEAAEKLMINKGNDVYVKIQKKQATPYENAVKAQESKEKLPSVSLDPDNNPQIALEQTPEVSSVVETEKENSYLTSVSQPEEDSDNEIIKENDSVQEDLVEEVIYEEPDVEESFIAEEPLVEEEPLITETDDIVEEEPVEVVEELIEEEPIEVVEEPIEEEPIEVVEEPIEEEPIEVVEEPIEEEPIEVVEEPIEEEPVEVVEEPIEEDIEVVEEPIEEEPVELVEEITEDEVVELEEENSLYGEEIPFTPEEEIVENSEPEEILDEVTPEEVAELEDENTALGDEIALVPEIEPEEKVIEEEPIVDEIVELEDENLEYGEEIADLPQEVVVDDDSLDIVLIPTEMNPAEVDQTLVENIETVDELIVDEDLSESAETTVEEIVIIPEVQKNISSTNSLNELIRDETELSVNTYYVQLATLKDVENIEKIIGSYGKKYPLNLLQKDNGTYQVLVGPLSNDEYEVVLMRFKQKEFKDAFVKKIK